MFGDDVVFYSLYSRRQFTADTHSLRFLFQWVFLRLARRFRYDCHKFFGYRYVGFLFGLYVFFYRHFRFLVSRKYVCHSVCGKSSIDKDR